MSIQVAHNSWDEQMIQSNLGYDDIDHSNFFHSNSLYTVSLGMQ